MSGDASTPEQDPAQAVSDGQQPVETSSDPVETTAAPDPGTAAEASPQTADNEARLEQLEREHSTLRDEHDVLRGQYMRIAADFDNFERARQQLDPQGEEAQALHRSYQGLYKQLVDVLKQLGVAPMRVVGQEFDPTLHEAVLREPSDEHPEDVVIEELQRGYHLNGKVLRHAMVKVSMGPGPQDGASSPSAEAAPADAPAEESGSGDGNG